MGYSDIDNLYKNQEILMFKECWALEKIHGTSAHICWMSGNNPENPEPPSLTFFSGGAKHEAFVKLFDESKLREVFITMNRPIITVYGEAYGGKEQGMSATYGKQLKFIVFDIKIVHSWLCVPEAEEVAKSLGLEYVSYQRISTTIEAIDAQRDLPSVQAIRNGILESKKREGVVLRPIIEVKKNNGERICAKHKTEDFQERKSQPKVTDAAKLKVLSEAKAIAEEWVTPMRLIHVLDHIKANKQKQDLSMEDIPDIMKEMLADVSKEASGEIIESKDARKAISSKTAQLFKEHCKDQLKKIVS